MTAPVRNVLVALVIAADIGIGWGFIDRLSKWAEPMPYTIASTIYLGIFCLAFGLVLVAVNLYLVKRIQGER